MAKQIRTVVDIYDDLTGALLTEDDVQTVVYAIDGHSYEIDLSNKNASDLRELLTPIVRASRRVGKHTIPAPTHRQRSHHARQASSEPLMLPSSEDGFSKPGDSSYGESKRAGVRFRREVRLWAMDQGFDQQMSGRIKEDVAAAWNAAHPDRPFREGM